jgi:transposase
MGAGAQVSLSPAARIVASNTPSGRDLTEDSQGRRLVRVSVDAQGYHHRGKRRGSCPIDVVGLYLEPPAHAIVLSVDEKSQIQALDRTQPGLPMKKGRAGTMTHDYKRHGTTTLFAALNVLDGTVIGRNMQRHRHQEFIRFLNAIERTVPAGKQVHAILDNYAAHKHPKVRAWLDRNPRWTFHFVPTSCSWLNAVEGFFAKLSKRRLKRGVFHSIVDLQAAINRFVREHNAEPKPFTWTAEPDRIIAAVKRGHQVLDSFH